MKISIPLQAILFAIAVFLGTAFFTVMMWAILFYTAKQIFM